MRVRFTEKKVLGLMLCSTGTGMFIVAVIPWWGFIIAAVLVIVGFLLLSSKC